MQFSDSKESRQYIGEENEIEYEKILEKIGFGKAQWILLIISGLITVTSLAAQTSVGIMALASQCEFEMSQAEKGVMMAACSAGIFLSTYFWGTISDAVGRRPLLLYGTLGTNMMQFISLFITNIWFFNFINLLMGISLGGVSGAMYAYLGEFNTSKHRAVVIHYSTMFVSIASIYTPATAWWVLSADWSLTIFEGFVFRPWRLIIILNLLPGFIGALMLLPFPESPELLLAHNKETKAKAAVEWICRFNTGGRSVGSVLNNNDYILKSKVIAEEHTLANQHGCGILTNIWKSTVPLFYKPHVLNFVISCLAVFGLFFTSVGMQIWYPEIANRSSDDGASNSSYTVCEMLDASFKREHLNSTQQQSEICDDSISTQTYIDNIIVGFAFLIGFSIQGTLLNPLGRKNVLLATLALGVLSGILFNFITNAKVVVVLFCLYILMPGLSISIMCGAVVDLVPTHLRGTAVAISFTLGRLGVIVATNLVAVMLEPLCNTTFTIFTGTMLVCAFLVHFLPI